MSNSSETFAAFNAGSTGMFSGTSCALVLMHRGNNGWTPDVKPRQWTLSFQQRPTVAVTLEGDDPTRDEIVKACAGLAWMPTLMVDVIECIAAQLVSARAALASAQSPE